MLILSILGSILAAAGLGAQDLGKIENVCSAEDQDAFGLTCSEDDPCPVYLELSSVDGFGASVFVSGNLHTQDTTMFGLLLASDDGGKTWTEPVKRVRASALGQIQFVDPQHGWISGMKLDPLPRDPFLLSTVNGGEAWHQTQLFADPDFGSIQQFWFDSDSRGQLVADRSQGKAGHFELYQTSDGGTTWTMKDSSSEPIKLKNAKSPDAANFRVMADKDSYRVEQRTASGWETLGRFPIHAGDCK